MKVFGNARRKLIAGVVTGVALTGAAGSAWATTSPSTTPAGSASTTTSVAATHAQGLHKKHNRHHKARTLLARSDHATFEVKQKGVWVTIAVDRGKVTSASATEITLARPDGQSVTLSLSTSTVFRGVSSSGQLTVGKHAAVVSRNGTASRVEQKHARIEAPSTTPSTPAPTTSTPAAG